MMVQMQERSRGVIYFLGVNVKEGRLEESPD
jgi:hypothetical protein